MGIVAYIIDLFSELQWEFENNSANFQIQDSNLSSILREERLELFMFDESILDFIVQ